MEIRGEKKLRAEAEDYDGSLWNTVKLPHTWNAEDGADGGNDYSRGTYWYRKTIENNSSFEGKHIYLEFLGANQTTGLYVNGEAVELCNISEYFHQGGYTAFCFDITDAVGPATIRSR